MQALRRAGASGRSEDPRSSRDRGNGGPQRLGGPPVCRSNTLDGNVTRHRDIAITTGARTLIDISATLPRRATAKAFREAIRLRATTMRSLLRALEEHRGRRGTAVLRDLAARYHAVP